jgi:uncharacterized SAM-binding protein YcdF (DUF218 family)
MKELFSPLTEPIGAIWLLMLLGLIWSLWRRCWTSAILLGIPTFLLFFVGSTPFAGVLVDKEEAIWDGKILSGHDNPISKSREFNATEEKRTEGTVTNSPADAVIVLGGEARESSLDAFGFAPTDAWARMITAVELVRLGRAKMLVLGGSYSFADKPELPQMVAVQDWINAWKLAPGGVTNLGICWNTHDEAVAFDRLKKGQGWNSVILVTSALHLRRSVALFKKLGCEVEPIAADFEVHGGAFKWNFSLFPKQYRFTLLALYLHEKIGWLVYRYKGWIDG